MSLEKTPQKFDEDEDEDEDNLYPDSEYWSETTYKNYNKSNLEYEDFLKTLDPIDSKTLEIIENINGVVNFGVNFTSKIIGFDELVNCYLGNINSIESKTDKEDNLVSLNRSPNKFYGKPVLGIRSFVRFPGGIIEYHKSNRKLFNTSTISLMINKATFPLHFIEEFSDSNKLFKIKRSNGMEQMASICENSSMFWSESRSTKTDAKWRIQMYFCDISKMNEMEILESNKNLKENSIGDFVKTLFLTEIIKLNKLDCITLEITKLKMSLRETVINEELEEHYVSGYDIDSNNEMIEINDSNDTQSETLFIDRDYQPDIILNNYHSIITNGVINYFEKRLDEYIVVVKKSLSREGINVIVK